VSLPPDADPDVPTGPERSHRARRRVVGAVALGGAIGAPLRYEVALHVASGSAGFPLSTFLINVSGAFVLGLLVTLVAERWPPTRYVRPFFGTGVLGAYTTWSTFMVDSDELIKDGHGPMAILYITATLVAGLGAAVAGIRLARLAPVRPAPA
jgi:fluoride exporter